MRCLQFDEEVIRALRALGFTVEDDKESASVEATIGLIHPASDKCFWLSIDLPCGCSLHLREFTRADILDTAAEQIESYD